MTDLCALVGLCTSQKALKVAESEKKICRFTDAYAISIVIYIGQLMGPSAISGHLSKWVPAKSGFQ